MKIGRIERKVICVHHGVKILFDVYLKVCASQLTFGKAPEIQLQQLTFESIVSNVI